MTAYRSLSNGSPSSHGSPMTALEGDQAARLAASFLELGGSTPQTPHC